MSNYLWNTVKAPRHGVNTFDLSHEVKTTTDFGRITPIACEEVLPGDKFRVNSEVFARLSPLITPVMQNIDIYVHWFFVPNRIIWRGWERFITQSAGGRSLPASSPSGGQLQAPQQLPSFKFTKTFLSGTTAAADEIRALFGNSSLPDYLGLGVTSIDGTLNHPGQWTWDLEFNALPFVAYQRIWYDFYRDENIDSDFSFGQSNDAGQYVWDELEDAPVLSAQGSNIWVDSFVEQPELILGLRYRSYRKDYFTSALPFVQKGSDITLPLSGQLSITQDYASSGPYFQYINGAPRGTDDLMPLVHRYDAGGINPGANIYTEEGAQFNLAPSFVGAHANLEDGVSVTINELRRANALQKWEEANARGGTRYVEQVLAHFGVVGDDARMQRAEYLGGGRIPVNISEVLQTSETTSSSPQGNPAGRGVAAGSRLGFTSRTFKEHGWVMGLLTVMPKASYFQGARRFFGKRHWEDFGWPLLANLGEQPIYRFELYNNGIPTNPDSVDDVFGYTPRYAEYKFSPDKTCGDFRDGLLDWHLARRFGNVPRLNADFLHVKPENNNRIFAVADGDHFWLQIYHNIKVIRHLPRYGTPSL